MFVPHQKSNVDAPTPDVIAFGDRDFMEVINVKLGHKGGTLVQ